MTSTFIAPIARPDPSNPISAMSALEQAARVRDGSLTSAALVDYYLGRIGHVNPEVHAFVDLIAGAARRDAEKADRERLKGRFRGPFHGVPTGIKDLHFVRGTYTRLGSRGYRYLWSPFDDAYTKTVRAGGFIVLGKTATSELALLPIIETDIHPPVRNPWNLEHTSGGSSGGAGCAVAAGLVPIAPGSDGGGSIRIPSSINGLFGLKPSRGLAVSPGDRFDVVRMTAIGPMARTVDDAATMMDVLSLKSPGAGDSLSVRSKERVRPLKIGVLHEPPTGETDPRVSAVVKQAADRLVALGHSVREVAPIKASIREFLPIYERLFAAIPALLPGKLQPTTKWVRDEGRALKPGQADAAFKELCGRALRMMEGIDVLLTPTVPVVPPKIGAFNGLPPAEHFETVAIMGAFTAAWNITGLPAFSVPFGSVAGLPVGVQLVGHPNTDASLLSLGRDLTDRA